MLFRSGKEKSIAPNAMWTKRPRGQLAKCAAAQALRSAFPEIAAQYTQDEMEGKTINDVMEEDGEVLEQPKYLGVTVQRAKIIRAAAGAALQKFNENDDLGAYAEVEAFEESNDETLALFSILRPYPDLRATLKRLSQEKRKRQQDIDEMEKAFSEVTPVVEPAP